MNTASVGIEVAVGQRHLLVLRLTPAQKALGIDEGEICLVDILDCSVKVNAIKG